MSGYLQKLHKGKKWKKMWFVLKDKVLYQFKATQVTHNTTILQSFLFLMAFFHQLTILDLISSLSIVY